MSWWDSLDLVIIQIYRLTGHPVIDYFTGTFLLALWAMLLGEMTASLVYRVNRDYVRGLNERLRELQQLADLAWQRKDRISYRAVNREANDTFGLLFFGLTAMSAAYLWPAFFALAWMHERFSGIEFPLPWLGWKTNYFFTFLVCYLLVRILYSQIKPILPWFRSAGH